MSNVWTVISTEAEESIANSAFSLVSRTEQFSGKRIYKYTIDEEKGWAQSEFLAMELSGDLLPTNGGVEVWKTDELAFLFTQTRFVSQIQIENEIIAEDGTYCILMHRQ